MIFRNSFLIDYKTGRLYKLIRINYLRKEKDYGWIFS